MPIIMVKVTTPVVEYAGATVIEVSDSSITFTVKKARSKGKLLKYTYPLSRIVGAYDIESAGSAVVVVKSTQNDNDILSGIQADDLTVANGMVSGTDGEGSAFIINEANVEIEDEEEESEGGKKGKKAPAKKAAPAKGKGKKVEEEEEEEEEDEEEKPAKKGKKAPAKPAKKGKKDEDFEEDEDEDGEWGDDEEDEDEEDEKPKKKAPAKGKGKKVEEEEEEEEEAC